MLLKCMLLVVVLTGACLGASGQNSGAAAQRLNWWDNIPGYIDAQHGASLAAVTASLEKYPPVAGACVERHTALLLLDNVLHDPDVTERPAVQAFFVDRARLVTEALQREQVAAGARIWKLYNDGFIVRTASATIAFDLVSGRHIRGGGFQLPDDSVESFVNACDVLFISHGHEDHADPEFVERFIAAGKPVLAPEGLWERQPFAGGLRYLERAPEMVQEVAIRGGAAKLLVANYPGHQGEVLVNNVVVVKTPEGLTFAQTGDQSNQEDFAWIDGAAKAHRVDVLMPNCWSPDLPRLIAGFDPAVVIPGHENEISHTVDHREPHWLDPARLGDQAARAVIMTWGECFAYTRK